MNQINIFESIEALEPRCSGCDVKLDYGVNTSYSDKFHAHVCNQCRAVVK